MCKADKVGNFANGKEMDALVIDLNVEGSPIDAFLPKDLGQEEYMDMFQRFIYNGDDRNIVQVFVKGKQVKI